MALERTSFWNAELFYIYNKDLLSWDGRFWVDKKTKKRISYEQLIVFHAQPVIDWMVRNGHKAWARSSAKEYNLKIMVNWSKPLFLENKDIVVATVPQEERGMPAEDRVLLAIMRGASTENQIAIETGLNNNTIKGAIHRWKTKGAIERSPEGGYVFRGAKGA